MELELRIIRDPCQSIAKQRKRVFAESGGTIGRAPDNYWVLPDPQSYVSGHHCDVEFRDGSFWLRDRSRNGVFLNHANEPLERAVPTPLMDGDRLTIAGYEIAVRYHESLRSESGGRRARRRSAGVSSAAERGEAGKSESARGKLPQWLQMSDDVVVEERPPRKENVTDEPEDDDDSSFGDTHSPMDLPRPAVSTRYLEIDRAALIEAGLIPPEKAERQTARQFRRIKLPLVTKAKAEGEDAIENGHLIMVTSALPGEGKTFSTVNLALSMARERDTELVMIDADVAKPHISSAFGLAEAPGLMDALSDESIDVESLVVRTDVEGLYILPAGRFEEDSATELLSSAHMKRIVARLASRVPRRLALFDSPPLLLTTEAHVLTTLVGQIVLVVRAGVTPQQALFDAISTIGEDKPIGVVLNQSVGHPSAGYGSYGGYGAYGAYGNYGTYGTYDAPVGGSPETPPDPATRVDRS